MLPASSLPTVGQTLGPETIQFQLLVRWQERLPTAEAYAVLGQVNRSGTYEFPDEGPLDLLQALGLAGGYTSIADPSKVIIRRVASGKGISFRVNAKKLASWQLDEQIQVMPGDVISVSKTIF